MCIQRLKNLRGRLAGNSYDKTDLPRKGVDMPFGTVGNDG